MIEKDCFSAENTISLFHSKRERVCVCVCLRAKEREEYGWTPASLNHLTTLPILGRTSQAIGSDESGRSIDSRRLCRLNRDDPARASSRGIDLRALLPPIIIARGERQREGKRFASSKAGNIPHKKHFGENG